MTQLNMDRPKRWHGAAYLVLAVAGLLLAPVANAQVKVANSVQKVETYVDEQGVAQRRLVGVDSVVPGDELRYTISFTNAGEGDVDAGSIVITNPVPENTEYLDGTANGAGTQILFSADSGTTFGEGAELKVVSDGARRIAAARDYTTIQWQFVPTLAPGETGHVSFNVKLK